LKGPQNTLLTNNKIKAILLQYFMNFIVILILISLSAFAGEEIEIRATGKNPNEVTLVHTPDMIELLADIDPKAYGYRAQEHWMAVNLGIDPVFNGRLTLDYTLKLNSYFKLVFPVTFEHTKLVLPLGMSVGILSNNRIEDQWSLLAGTGVKIRLTEWSNKSSLYTEVLFQAGTYGQSAKGFSDMRHAVRLRPSVYVGWERVFETGLVLGAKAGVEYNVNLASQSTLVYNTDGFNFAPMINLGFAW
jgi:hypothetical protein